MSSFHARFRGTLTHRVTQVEFDKPSELLKNERGLLHMLVKESGDKEKLYAMANYL